MSKIYLVRHGHSEGNLKKIFTGTLDEPLTELGQAQSRLTGEYLSGVRFDAAFSSDLTRAYETAEIITDRKVAVFQISGLNELFGGLWQGKSFEEIGKLYPAEYEKWRFDISNACPPGGESVLSLYARVNSALDLIATRHYDNILICTHAIPIRCIISRIMWECPSKIAEVPWVPNASVTVLDFAGGNYSAETIAYSEHLGALSTNLPKTI